MLGLDNKKHCLRWWDAKSLVVNPLRASKKGWLIHGHGSMDYSNLIFACFICFFRFFTNPRSRIFTEKYQYINNLFDIVGVASLTSGKPSIRLHCIPEDMSRTRARMKQAMPSATKSVPRFIWKSAAGKERISLQVPEPQKKAVFFVFGLGPFCWEKNAKWIPTKQQNIALTGLCNVAQVFTDGFSTTWPWQNMDGFWPWPLNKIRSVT